MNLVPTASTTAALAMGDALAMSVLVEKGFKPEDFANLHPGGKLGKKLMRVEQLMNAGDALPVVQLHTAMRDVIYEMSRKKLGMTVGRRKGRASRRHHHRRRPAPQDGDHAEHPGSHRPRRHDDRIRWRFRTTTLAVEALALMEQRKITSIVVIDAERRVEGVVHLHDLWQAPAWSRTADEPRRIPPVPRGAGRAARSAWRSARRGNATSCATASGSIAAARATRITTCSA